MDAYKQYACCCSVVECSTKVAYTLLGDGGAMFSLPFLVAELTFPLITEVRCVSLQLTLHVFSPVFTLNIWSSFVG